MRMRHVAVLAAAAALAVPASARGVGEIFQLAAPYGCLVSGGSGGPCGPLSVPFMAGLSAVAASPDGKNVYVVSDSASVVLILARDATTGRLTETGCVGSGAGCGAATPLSAPGGIAVSPDGKNAYVTGRMSGSVVVFQRDGGTGALTQQGCMTSAAVAGCTVARALDEPVGVAVSPDRKFVYVASQASDAVAVFAVDPANGALTQAAGTSGCVSATGAPGCATHAALDGAFQVETGSDRVYVTSRAAHALVSLGQTATGVTTLPAPDGCAASGPVAGCAIAPLGDNPGGIAVTPDGSHVFVTANGNDDRVLSFDRTAGGISLHPGTAGCVSNGALSGCTPARALADPSDLALVAGQLYVVSSNSGSMTGLDASADGGLGSRPGLLDCVASSDTSCSLGSGLQGAIAVAASSDARHIYMASLRGAVAAFRRDSAGPVCADVSLSTPHETPVAVPLACTDPDGDPVGVSIVSLPAGGRLGPLDGANGRVMFSPNPGFSGIATFTFRGRSVGSDSSVATARITVAPASPVPRILATTISSSWVAGRRFTRNKTLVLKSVPARAKIRTTCKGRGCPFKSRSRTVRTAAKQLKLTALFKKRRLRPGAVVEVRVTLAGRIGKAFRFTTRRSRQPRKQTLCLLPGSSKAMVC